MQMPLGSEQHNPGRKAYLVALLAGFIVAATGSALLPADLVDPIPLRRVPIDAERVAAEMAKVGQGMLVQLSRAEFEERVRLAARAVESAKTPPRLVEAHYRAVLADNALVGTAQWKVMNPAAGPALLPLNSFNLAVRRARFENTEATLAEFDGKTLGLYLDKDGPHALDLDWSARGEVRPNGLFFDLEVPACAIASFELNLPIEDSVAVLSDGCLLSGPLPAQATDQRLWKVVCAGQAQIHFTISRDQGAGALPPLLFVHRLQTRQELSADVNHADFDFDLEVGGIGRNTAQGIREIQCECDPELRPIDVALRGLESWELRPGESGAPNTLFIRLRESFQGGGLQIHCLAPLESISAAGEGAEAKPRPPGSPRPVNWSCPRVRLAQAVTRGETLVLRISPDLQLENWQPGSFRLTQATTEADGGQTLTLTSGLIGDGRRPSARIQTQGADFRARQLAWWQVGPDRSFLTCQIHYEVSRGRLFQLPLLLPVGWEVDRVEMSPADWLRNWSVRPASSGSTLMVDLQRSLTVPNRTLVETAPRLTVRLRTTGSDMRRVMPFPDLVPLEARYREGVLAIDYDERVYQATITASVPSTTPEEEGPWGKQFPNFYYSYRGQALQGSIKLQPRRLRLQAHCSNDVYVTSGHINIESRLVLQADVGSPEVLDLYFSAPTAGKWEWRVRDGQNQVRRLERIPAVDAVGALGVLVATTPVHTLSALAVTNANAVWSVSPRGERWRLTFAQPLRVRKPLTLDGTCALERPAGVERWEVPIPIVLGAERMDGEVKLHLDRADVVQVEREGLRDVALSATRASAGGRAPVPWRTLRYGAGPVALALRGQAPSKESMTTELIDQAVLTTYVEPSGRLLHHYDFEVWNWHAWTLPVRLPTGARLLAASVDQRRVDPANESSAQGGSLELKLPVPQSDSPAGTRACRIEIVYATEQPAWRFWASLEAPLPEAPVQPIAVRRTWCLPSDAAPLFDGKMRRLPGPKVEGSNAIDNRFLPVILSGLRSSANDEAFHQHQLMDDAGLALAQARSGKAMTLGAMLYHLVFDHLKEQAPLVLDIVALREAGLRLETPLPLEPAPRGEGAPPPWAALGLEHGSCRAAPLLTTRLEKESWRIALGRDDTVPESVEEAVAEAAMYGHDRSGRFRTAVSWLRGQSSRPPDPNALLLLGSPPRTDWTEWEAHTDVDDCVLIVRGDWAGRAGVVLAAGLCLVCWRTRNRLPRRRLFGLLLWLGLSGLAVFWLPASLRGLAYWPLLAAMGTGLLWYLESAAGGVPWLSAAGPGITALLVFVIAAALLIPTAHGEDTDPQAATPAATVFLVPGPANAPDKQTVLASSALLDQLQTLSRRVGAVPQGAFLLSAVYDGKVIDSSAEFDAEFLVHSFTDEPAELMLPLDGIHLLDSVLLDGARAYPVARRAPLTGYSLAIEGRGRHRLQVRFRVPVASLSDERSMQFTMPRLALSRLALAVPPGASLPRMPGRQGALTWTTSTEGARLEVDLGRAGNPLLLRWQQNEATARPVVQVKEAYLWHLQPGMSNLLAVFQYKVMRGSVPALTIELPDGLEARAVEASLVAEERPVRVRAAHLSEAAGRRALRLEFQNPVSGDIRVQLQFTLERPLESNLHLPLPTPQEVESMERFLAFRLNGLEGRTPNFRGATGIRTEVFARLWQLATGADPGRLAYACRYRREPGIVPIVRLQSAPARLDTEQELAWRVGSRQADLRATAKMTAPNGDLSMVEWDVPADVSVSRVTGKDVRYWTRTGTRVQVWLQRSLAGTEIQLQGWTALRMPPRLKMSDTAPFLNLPLIQFPSATSRKTVVRLSTSGELNLEPTGLVNLVASAGAPTTGLDLAFVAQSGGYKGTVHVRPLGAKLTARVLTFMEVRDRQLTFEATVDCQAPAGGPRHVSVRLRDWEGDVHLEAPALVQRRERRRDPASRIWEFDLEPSSTGRQRLIFTGSMPIEDSIAGIPLPDITVLDAMSERWLAVAGQDLTAEDAQGLSLLKNGSQALQDSWPREADRVSRTKGLVWKIAANDWSLRLSFHDRVPAANALQVVMEENSAAVADGRRWLHQASYWVYHEGNIDLNVSFPADVRVLAVAVDSSELAALQPGPRRLWLPLPGGDGVRHVRIRWMFSPGTEGLEEPILDPPHLEGAPNDHLSVWTVHLPVGQTVAGKALVTPLRPASGADLDLGRARAQARLSQVVAERVAGRSETFMAPFLAAQKRFYHYCRLVDYGLSAISIPPPGVVPRGQTVEEWVEDRRKQLREVMEENVRMAQSHGLEELRKQAETETRPERDGWIDTEESTASLTATSGTLLPAMLPDRGTPLAWIAESADSAPHVSLTTVHTKQARRALVGSMLLLLTVVAIGLLASFPRIVARVQVFWPEQLALLGCIGWLTSGLGTVVLCLAVLGLSVRFYLLGRWAWAIFKVSSNTSPAPVSPDASS